MKELREKIHRLISKGHGNYVLGDHTEFCQLKVELGQLEVEEERKYKLEKHQYSLDLGSEVIKRRSMKNKDTGKLYTVGDAEAKASKETYDKYVDLLTLEAKIKAIKNLYKDMNDFRVAIKMEVDVTFNASVTQPSIEIPIGTIHPDNW